MNIINKLKRVAQVGLVFGVFTAAVAGAGLFSNQYAPVAAASCDKVNVVYCGLNQTSLTTEISSLKADYNKNVSGHPSDYHDVKTIFNYVGANQSLIDSMNTSNTVKGSILRNGNIVVNGKVIATKARIVARFSVPGAVKVPGTSNAYLRYASSYLYRPSEPIIVRLDAKGDMLFGAGTTCGNAITATPVPHPSYNINKEVAVKGSSAYAKSVNVKPGTHVTYRITVSSTGNVPVTNLNVKDKLPVDVSYVAGTLKRDNAVVASSNFFSTGITVTSLKQGTSTVFTFEAIVGPKDTVEVCVNETLPNLASMTATGLPGDNSTATVTKECLPKPVYQCTNLTPAYNSRDTVTFTAKAVAQNGAIISSYNYNFGDGSTKVVTTAAATSTAQHTYAAPGTFNATVSVTVKLPGLPDRTVTSTGCATSVTIKPAPAAECTNLSLNQDANNPRLVAADVTYKVENGATLTNVSYNWDDGSVVNNGVKTSASHTYQKDGDFNVVATLSFSSGLAPSTCEAPITVTTVMPTCDNLTVDVNNDDKTVVIKSLTFTNNNGAYQTTSLNWGDSTPAVVASDITGHSHTYNANGPFTIIATTHFTVNGQDVAVNSPSCQKQVSFTETPTPPVKPPVVPPVVPPTLVNTGAGSTIGLFAGVAALGTLGYRFFLSRRLSN